MVTYKIPNELIFKHTEKEHYIRYTVTIYDLGFYIRIDQSDDQDNWKLINVTTRNQPEKIKAFYKQKTNSHKEEGYRVVKDTEQNAYYNPKTRRYSNARANLI